MDVRRVLPGRPHWRGASGLTLLLALGWVGGGASAADAPAGGIDEVVVSAEKRTSTVQSTGIGITALKGADLTEAGIADMQSIAEQVPGISFKTGGPGQTEFEMRGLNSAGGNAPTVGFYLNETPLASFAYATAGKVAIDPDLYDLKRVEVLRGPQGTLYGAGSMGGTLRLLTNESDPEAYHGSVYLEGSGTEGGGANGTVNAMVNLPLVADKVALRIVGTDKYESGWIDRVTLADFPPPGNGGLTRGTVTDAAIASEKKNYNTEHLQGIRATLGLTPTDALSITSMVMVQNIDAGGQSLVDDPPGTEAHYAPFATSEPVRDRFSLESVTIKYELPEVELVSATSHWRRALNQIQDGAEVMQDVVGLPSYYVGGGGIGYDAWTEQDVASQVSEEFRVASRDESAALQWLGGFFYSHLDSTTDQYSIDSNAVGALGLATLYNEHVPQSFDQKAIFGEATYAVADDLKATVGLRYFLFDNRFSTSEYGFFGPYGSMTPGGSSSTESDHGINPKFNLTWTPGRDVTLYGTISKGFRPGGGNQIVPISGTEEGAACAASLRALGKSANPTSYDPDEVWNYEVGEKLRLFDGRLTLNGALYYEDWSNIQRAVTLSCGYIYSDNAGSANVYGSELEMAAKLTPELSLSLNGAYTDATYAETSLEAGVSKGQSLPDVPRFTSSQSLVYRHPIDDTLVFTGRFTNNFISARQDVTYAVDRMPAYDLASIRLGVAAEAGWTVFLSVDNIGNAHALLSAINSQVLNIPTMTRDTTNRPRTYGAGLQYEF